MNIICPMCDVIFTKSKVTQKFCSVKCQSRFNVSKHRKANMKKCLSCNKTAILKESNSCKECYIAACHEQKLVSMGMTIGYYRNKLSIKNKHPSWTNAHIRQFCREWNKELTKQACKSCGYSKHVELAHIKPVCSFPETALLSEVNNPLNLIPLCRNCHWEFDNGYLMASQKGVEPTN